MPRSCRSGVTIRKKSGAGGSVSNASTSPMMRSCNARAGISPSMKRTFRGRGALKRRNIPALAAA
jgi:hypothetical protein